jgi:asparagine synthase (glutamine-hydrolysing)
MGVNAMNGFSGLLGSDWNCVIIGSTVTRMLNEKTYGAAFCGELYGGNRQKNGSETVLYEFLERGEKFTDALDGVFAIAVWDSDKLHLFRDRIGVKRLFYTDSAPYVFSTDISGILLFPGFSAEIDAGGLAELFAVGPARTPGCAYIKGIKEVLPGEHVTISRKGITVSKYWDVKCAEHTDSYNETLEKTRFLVTDAIKRQMGADDNLCSLLSGGLDSSIISAVASDEYRSGGKVLDTFSFDFDGNDEHFKGSAFQPDQDLPWAVKTSEYLGTSHKFIKCSVTDFSGLLYDAVDARGFPGMADVDSSLLYFLGCVSKTHKYALTGEAADEIFCGYPWYHKQNDPNHFPWNGGIGFRKALLSADFLARIDPDIYAQARYAEAVAQTPLLQGETAEQTEHRKLLYINLKYFMRVLVERFVSMGEKSGITPIMPFADHKLIEYIWNVPWSMKCRGGVVKSLLRDSFKGILPDEVLYRRKSPFPKSYDPEYENILSEMFSETVTKNSPISGIIDINKTQAFIKSPKDLGMPWFGQLMAGPQMVAYLLQINYWLTKFKIRIMC